MTSQITTLGPTDKGSESRLAINDNFAARHSLDRTTITHAASPYTVLASDQWIEADASAGAITILLPAVASSDNRSIYVTTKSVAGGNVTIDGNASETINGSTTLVLSAQYAGKRLLCNSSGWYAI